MDKIIESLLNPWVLIYLFVVMFTPVATAWYRRNQERVLQQKRVDAGLPANNVLIDHKMQLASIKKGAMVDSALLVCSVVITPFVILYLGYSNATDAIGLATAFLVLLLWVLFSNAELGKAWLGGTLFKLLIGFKAPFQIGDRVTLMGYSGKVVEIGSFLVKLQTPDDDLVSLPTYRLWSESLVSANAGDRASLCVVNFYLSPAVGGRQLQMAEDAIWDSAQASVYFEFSRPLQVYISQHENAIVLTVKAYVASTYNEPLFKSDITRAFLEAAERNSLPLACPEVHIRELKAQNSS